MPHLAWDSRRVASRLQPAAPETSLPREIDWIEHYRRLSDAQLQALTRSWPNAFSAAAWRALTAEWARRGVENPHPEHAPEEQ